MWFVAWAKTLAQRTAYDARVATLENLEGILQTLRDRVAAVETSQTDFRALAASIKAFGETQQMLADAMRNFGNNMRTTADENNLRIRQLEASAAEIKASIAEVKALLVKALER